MNGPDHFREAERRLLMAWEEGRDPANSAHLVAEAQVHATLALAAATALTIPQMWQSGPPYADLVTWHAAVVGQPQPAGEPGQVAPKLAAPVRIDSGLYGSVVSHPAWNDGKPVWLTRLDDDDVDGVPPGHMRVEWQADAPAPAEGSATVPADFMVTPYDGQVEADSVAQVRIDNLFGLIKQQDISVVHPDWNDGKPVELAELHRMADDRVDVTYCVPETHAYHDVTVAPDFLVTPA